MEFSKTFTLNTRVKECNPNHIPTLEKSDIPMKMNFDKEEEDGQVTYLSDDKKVIMRANKGTDNKLRDIRFSIVFEITDMYINKTDFDGDTI